MRHKLVMNKQSGQGLAEYSIILCLIGVAAIGVTGLFGGVIKTKIASLAGAVGGKDGSQVEAYEKKVSKVVDDAQKNALKIKGDMSIKKDVDIIETKK